MLASTRYPSHPNWRNNSIDWVKWPWSDMPKVMISGNVFNSFPHHFSQKNTHYLPLCAHPYTYLPPFYFPRYVMAVGVFYLDAHLPPLLTRSPYTHLPPFLTSFPLYLSFVPVYILVQCMYKLKLPSLERNIQLKPQSQPAPLCPHHSQRTIIGTSTNAN